MQSSAWKTYCRSSSKGTPRKEVTDSERTERYWKALESYVFEYEKVIEGPFSDTHGSPGELANEDRTLFIETDFGDKLRHQTPSHSSVPNTVTDHKN